MYPNKLALAVGSAMSLMAIGAANAGTDVFFNPLTQSSAVATPNHINEVNSPWQVPAGVSYKNLTSMKEVEGNVAQSIIRVPSLGSNASMFDMVSYDPSGKYVFIPHETQFGAGVTRYSIENDFAEVIMAGDASGNWASDYGAFDPSTWTPNDTLLVAEEWSGQGRVFEITNPMASVSMIQFRELNSIPNVSHEGLRFNRDSTALYFVDEDNSGSIYKFVPTVKGDYTKGQSFVLVVDAYTGNPAATYNNAANVGQPRTGAATWVAITDADGNKLTPSDPFDNATRGGRAAANEINGAPYGRPEDVEVGRLANGNEVLYFAATSELAVYSVEELGNNKAMVHLAASEIGTPKNLGFAATTGKINSPDNLAQDALGNIYIIEDWPNSDTVGGDVWFMRDVNGDGVAESVDHFMSLQVNGAEATGMIFNPTKPTEFVMAVQHPTTTATLGQQGDALWVFDISNVLAPPCTDKDDSDNRRDHEHGVKTCDNSDSSNFIKKLQHAGKSY